MTSAPWPLSNLTSYHQWSSPFHALTAMVPAWTLPSFEKFPFQNHLLKNPSFWPQIISSDFTMSSKAPWLFLINLRILFFPCPPLQGYILQLITSVTLWPTLLFPSCPSSKAPTLAEACHLLFLCLSAARESHRRAVWHHCKLRLISPTQALTTAQKT